MAAQPKESAMPIRYNLPADHNDTTLRYTRNVYDRELPTFERSTIEERFDCWFNNGWLLALLALGLVLVFSAMAGLA
jgi:hypothetical protein